MSYTFTCDVCAGEIDTRDAHTSIYTKHSVVDGATLSQRDEAKERAGWIGHYHEACWPAMLDRIEFVHETAQGLGAIPTLSEQTVGNPDRMQVVDPPTVAPRPAHLHWRELCDARRKPGGIYALEDMIPPSAWSAIARTEIVTVAQLEALTDEQLLAMRGIAATSVRRIRDAIAVHRLRQGVKS